MSWDTVIGLEVHAQLKTHSKLFSGSAVEFAAGPNSRTSFIDAGLPGVLPMLNQQAVALAIRFGLAVNADINNLSYFERKNYFYPDLPKGYQISQFQRPIVSNGSLQIETSQGIKQVEIVRAHLEEDAGKSVHDAVSGYSAIDLNRAGTALLEIVTSPCLYSAEEAVAYLKTLHQLLRFIGICDGNMQEGSFRCDVNISLKQSGSKTLGTRSELKNLNSFRFIEKAIAYEQQRQQELLENGEPVLQETRLFCPATESTQRMRGKENEQDYRYFPDPDLLPVWIEEADLETLKNSMPALPQDIKERLSKNLSDEDIAFLLSSLAVYNFFEKIHQHSDTDNKSIINWLKGPYATALNTAGLTFDHPLVAAEDIAVLLDAVHSKKLSNHAAKQIFSQALTGGEQTIQQRINEAAVTDDTQELETFISALLRNNPQQVADYQAGKQKILGFFVGQIMKHSSGRAEPETVNRLLMKHLNQ